MTQGQPAPSRWPGPDELRVGLGCMRLSTDLNRDEAEAQATIVAAVEAGITVFDTAHAYGPGEGDAGHNERLLASALREAGAATRARVVTKGGMARVGDQWLPDGRARTILADCEASLTALGGIQIDLYLVHAPDTHTPWATTVRALARLLDEGLVRRVGVANVNRPQLEEAMSITDVAAIQVALSLHDERAIRGGLVEHCERHGIAVMAHSPLGGPRRAPRIGRLEAVAAIAAARQATAAEVALSWLLRVSPVVVPIPGARHPGTARSAARAATVALATDELARLGRADEVVRSVGGVPRGRKGAQVMLLMGIPGAGKSRLAEGYVKDGYTRLNRDVAGGSLRDIAASLDRQLSAGARRVVVDNTYLTRAARSYVIEVAHRHRASTRVTWLDTPLAQAQVNLVERLLDRFGCLPSPEELRLAARHEPGVLMPTSQMRTVRELEAPSTEEGVAAVEVVPFARAAWDGRPNSGVFIAAAAISRPGWEAAVAEAAPSQPHLVFDWSPGPGPNRVDEAVGRLSQRVAGPVEGAVCRHEAGPPRCWCRPPLPGLALAFARVHGVDPSRSILVGTAAAHRTLATTLGARYVGL